MKFYVYAYISKDGSTVRYIGKGTRDRKDMSLGHRYFPEDSERRVMVVTGCTEEEAFWYEKTLIKFHGRIDLKTGTLTNLTDGGEGASGWVPTEEHRKKISQIVRQKITDGTLMTPEHKEKIAAAARTPEARSRRAEQMRGNSYREGIPHDEESRRKMSESGQARSAAGLNWAQQEENKKILSDRIKGDKNPMAGAVGWLNPFYGKQHPRELQDQINEKNMDDYVFEDPDGKIYRVHGLTRFCKEHGLERVIMGYIAAGKQEWHKKWRCWFAAEYDMMIAEGARPPAVPKDQRPDPKPYRRKMRLIDPDGKVYEIEGVSKFAKAHGLNPDALRRVANGKVQKGNHKGWKAEYMD